MTTAVDNRSLPGVVDAIAVETLDSGESKIIGDRRSTDAVAALSRRLNEVCTTAVTPLQIAALLEIEGFNDRLVVDRYGRRGVFSLAEELYERVPLRRDGSTLTTAAGSPVPIVQSRIAVAARMLLGLLWAVAIGIGAESLVGVGAAPAAVIAALFSVTLTAAVAGWQLEQMRVSLRAFTVTTGDPRQFARRARHAFGRASLICGLLLVAATGALAALTSPDNLPTEALVLIAVGLALLGSAVFASRVLISVDRIVAPLAGIAGLIVGISAVHHAVPLDPVAAARVFLVGCSAILLFTAAPALLASARPEVYR